ncbi:MAG TPA: hypothetical protein VF487_06030 [Chitinophagaceae bacterium]
MKKFVTFLFLLTASVVYSQPGGSEPNLSDVNKPVDILPPSPNAASLGQYGGINFGLASGTMSYSVPVYKLNSSQIEVPISIAYNSNGLKVDAIASRAGTGWDLEAGGVITRSVLGNADEEAQRVLPPVTYPQRNRALINFMQSLSTVGDSPSYDGQPDIFSFNFSGYNGRFILDNNLNPVLLTPSPIKIEKNFLSEQWNFKITTPDGVQYFFGGINATEKSKTFSTGTNCGKSYDAFKVTAWYLITIIHPNNDQINFLYAQIGYNYKASISETKFKKLTNFTSCPTGTGTCPDLSNSSCYSYYQVTTPLLTEINAVNGGKLTFTYTGRNDVGDKLIKKIEAYQPGQITPFRIFEMNYQEVYSLLGSNSYTSADLSLAWRPFLTEYIEKSTDGTLIKKFTFEYNDKEYVPTRLSFAQDHYGYYNGATGNTTFLPTPSTLEWQAYFPTATANRETNGVFAAKGLLSVVTYPTGGRDEILYEPNSVYTTIQVLPPLTSIDAQAQSLEIFDEPGDEGYSSTGVVSFQQEGHIYGSCDFYGSTSEADPIHNKGWIYLIDITTNTTVFTRTVRPGDVVDFIYESLNANHTYQVKAKASGVKVRVSGSLQYRAGQITTQQVNKETGGVRVSKITTINGSDGVSSIKRYRYHALSTPSISSGGPTYSPLYENYVNTKVKCDPVNSESGGTLVTCEFNECSSASMSSNSLHNIFIYGGASVYYSSVLESYGENYENGGIEHKYFVVPDVQGNNVTGTYIQNTPLTSYSYKNGLEYYQCAFRMQNGNVIPVKKTLTTYKEDTRIDQQFKSYLARKNYSVYCETDPPSFNEVDAYSLYEYSLLKKWIYPEIVQYQTYSPDGVNFVEEKSVTSYDNISHVLPSQIKTFSSDGTEKIIRNYYPEDILLTGPEETARTTLISKNIVSPILKQTVEKSGAPLLAIQNNYNFFSSTGLVLPFAKFSQKGNGVMEKRIEFPLYSSTGKLLEQRKPNDITTTYIWGHNSNYPIAEIQNANAPEVAYTSFEEESKGYWTYSGSPILDDNSITGKNQYNLGNGSLSRSVPNDKVYTVSYWSKGGGYAVNASPSNQVKTVNGWTLYIHNDVSPISGTITISGNGIIDEVKLYPHAAKMVSMTYEPYIGISSQTDINNNIIYYSYDGLGRLTLVKDEKKNVIKKICYNYAGQVENCVTCTNTNTSADWQNTITALRCQLNGSNQNTGYQEQEQKDMNLCSPTYNQLRWVTAGYNTTACPLPPQNIYAKISYTNWYFDAGGSYANVWIGFYSDAACTIPYSVSNLSVNYRKIKILCSSSQVITDNTISGSGYSISLGNQKMESYGTGTQCYELEYHVMPGTGYIDIY